MKIALIGYGKMGKAIEKIALAKGHSISVIVDSQHPIETINVEEIDVAIEFTRPEYAVKHINFCLSKQIPIVVGTTAWQKELLQVTESTIKQNGSLIHASNFSIGVNLFFEMNKKLANLMSTHTNYKLSIEEIHHTQKLDKPSGTAISLAEGIIDNNVNLSNWKLAEPHQSNLDSEILIHSIREENIPGTHAIYYDSFDDSIQFKHVAHTRDGFALGALIAAEWIINKKGIFTMQDVLHY